MQSCKVGVIIHIFQMGKLRHRATRSTAYGKCPSTMLRPSPGDPWPVQPPPPDACLASVLSLTQCPMCQPPGNLSYHPFQAVAFLTPISHGVAPAPLPRGPCHSLPLSSLGPWSLPRPTLRQVGWGALEVPKQLLPVPSHWLRGAGQRGQPVITEDSQCLSQLVFRKLSGKSCVVEKNLGQSSGVRACLAPLAV